MELIEQIASAMEASDKDDGVRAVVLCAQQIVSQRTSPGSASIRASA
jgi:hypothetical protein